MAQSKHCAHVWFFGVCCDPSPPLANTGEHGSVSKEPTAQSPHAMSTVVVAVLVWVVVGDVLLEGVVVCDEVCVVVVGVVVRELVAVEVAVELGVVLVVGVVVSVDATHPRNDPAT